jgi:hypothetical protein
VNITSWITGAVLYASATDTSVKEALAAAVKVGTNLKGANLEGANLIYALPVGDLRGYRPYATWFNDQWMICAGCRYFTIAQARAHWGSAEYPTPMRGAQYVAAMDWLERQDKPALDAEMERADG